MAYSSKRWRKNLPSTASRVFLLLIILQIPLFRIQCQSGMCTAPLQITSSQLIASEVFPVSLVKALLYPGAIANGLVRNMSIPGWADLLIIYNLTDVKGSMAVADLQRLEVLAGSYFSVAGALVGVVKPGRMSMFGTLLITWGLVREGILGKPVNMDPATAVHVYPTMLVALICAFSSVRYYVKRVARGALVQSAARPLSSSLKSKLK